MALTPTTALLYSFLDVSAFESPNASSSEALLEGKTGPEQDLFALAFKQHITEPSENYATHRSPLCQSKKPQSLYATPPLTTGEAIETPAAGFVENTPETSVILSQIPSYLEHVLSTQYPDDFFSYAQRCHNMTRLPPNLVDPRAVKENIPQASASKDIHDDPFTTPTGIHDTSSEQSGKSHPSPAADPANAKRPRKRRKNRTDEEEAARHKAFLERNRKAAGKCRSKKKDKVQRLIATMEASRQRNMELKAEHMELMVEVARLRDLARPRTELTDEQNVAIREASQGVKKEGESNVELGEEVGHEEVKKEQKVETDAMDEMDHETATEAKYLRDRVPSLVSTSSIETSEEAEVQSLNGCNEQEEECAKEMDYMIELMKE